MKVISVSAIILVTTLLFVTIASSASNNATAFKVTSTSCSDGREAGINDFSTTGMLNSKYSEHTQTYQDCYLDGWMESCLSFGNTRATCESGEDSQF